MKKYTILRGLAALALFTCLTSCQDEEFGYTTLDVKKGKYTRDFETTFGKIDSGHNWSMATFAQANVSLDGIKGASKMNIMTGDPHLKSTRLLAQLTLQDGKGSMEFDAIKGLDRVFVTVEQDNEYKLYDQYYIVDGKLNIVSGQNLVDQIANNGIPVTRVGVGNVTEQGVFSATCPAEKGDVIEVSNVTYDQGKSTQGHPTLQYLTGVEQVPAAPWSIGLGFNLFGNGKVFAESVPYWDDTKKAYYGESNLETMEKGLELITDGVHPIDVPYMFGVTDYANQFGYVYWKDGEDPLTKKHFVLMEDARPETNVYYGSWKGTSVGPKGLGQKLGEGSTIEQAIEYKDTPMEEWCHCNRGTGIWSEPYGTGAQLPMPQHDSYCTSLPHCYCGIGEDKPQSEHQSYCPMSKEPGPCNCSVASFNPNGAEGNGIYSSAMTHNGCVDPMDTYFNASNEQVYGTSYRLMFFGEDGNATTGSYIFPEGYHIAFWIDKLGSVDDLTAHSGYQEGNFNYSLPELNKRLGNSHVNNQRTGAATGLVKCITWTLDGVTYMGFGDNSGDQDLNDIVFIVRGAVPQNTVRMTAVKWHINYDGTHDETDSDLYDRYSLGIGKNYTQPDGTPQNGNKKFLGWSTTPSGATGYSKTISATSTSAVTCYYAIWEQSNTPTNVTIKWHINASGTHDTTDGDLFSSQSVNLGDTYTNPSGVPVNGGKEFLGWSTTPDNSSNDLSKEVSGVATEDKCYYAIWSQLPPVTPDPETISWIYACEDLGGTNDYDFNDVVWKLTKPVDGSDSPATVSVLAAGGTLDFALKFNGTTICTKTQTFDDIVKTDVVNANATEAQHGKNRTPKTFQVSSISSDWQVSRANSGANFSVSVESNSGSSYFIESYSYQGFDAAPQIIILADLDWQWPNENVTISEAHMGFTDWVSNANNTDGFLNGGSNGAALAPRPDSGESSNSTTSPVNPSTGSDPKYVVTSLVEGGNELLSTPVVVSGYRNNQTIDGFNKNDIVEGKTLVFSIFVNGQPFNFSEIKGNNWVTLSNAGWRIDEEGTISIPIDKEVRNHGNSLTLLWSGHEGEIVVSSIKVI